jgi:hypothetical protein
MYHEWAKRGILIGYWWESQKERDNWEDQDMDNIKCYLREIGWDVVDCIDMAQDRDQ